MLEYRYRVYVIYSGYAETRKILHDFLYYDMAYGFCECLKWSYKGGTLSIERIEV